MTILDYLKMILILMYFIGITIISEHTINRETDSFLIITALVIIIVLTIHALQLAIQPL
jgi:hypothetical protein